MRSARRILLAVITTCFFAAPVQAQHYTYTFTGFPCVLSTLPCTDPNQQQTVRFTRSSLVSSQLAVTEHGRTDGYAPGIEIQAYDWCVGCSSRFGVGFYQHILGGINGTGVPADVVAFNYDLPRGSGTRFYYFVDSSLSVVGTHRTTEWGPNCCFSNVGTITITATPEPNTSMLLAIGLVAIAGGIVRRQSRINATPCGERDRDAVGG